MEFLRPAAFWLFLLAVPIFLAHLLHRRRRRVPVSHLPFWEEILAGTRRRQGWRVLRNALGLLLTLLVLSLAIFAAAGPIRSDAARPEGPLVFLVDNALSTAAVEEDAGRSRLERLVLTAMLGAQGLDPRREVGVIALRPAPRWILLPSRDRHAMAQALRGLRSTPGDAAVSDVLRWAALGFPDEEVAWVYLTDGGPSSGAEALAELPHPPAAVCAGRSVSSTGLAHLSVDREWGRTRGSLFVRVRHSGPAATERRLRVTRNGELLAETSLVLPPTGEAPWQTELDLWGGGEVVVELEGTDALPMDDRLVWRGPALPLPRILVLAGTPQRTFLERALGAIGPDWFDPSGGVMESPPTERIPQAGEVVMVAGRGWPAGWAPHPLLWLGSPGPGCPRDAAGAVASPVFEQAGSVGLDSLRADRASAVRAASEDDVFLLAGGKAVGVRGEDRGRRFWIVAVDPAQSNLGLLPGFPLLLRDAVRELAGLDDPRTSGEVEGIRAGPRTDLAVRPVRLPPWRPPTAPPPAAPEPVPLDRLLAAAAALVALIEWWFWARTVPRL